MEKFAFAIHPLDTKDVTRKYPFARWLPDRIVEAAITLLPPLEASHITGVESPHAKVEGWFIGVPLTSRQMMQLPEHKVLKKIIGGGRIAERLGAKIYGLGAFTSVVGDAGVTVAKNLNIAVTTGNSYTVATALEGTKEAAKLMGIDIAEAQVAVVGATGAVGRVSSIILARDVKNLTIVGRDEGKLQQLRDEILKETGLVAQYSRDVSSILPDMDIIVAVSSAVGSIIRPQHLKPGAVVCDVARPRDVSRQVAEERDDVLVIEGGAVMVPGRDPNFNINFGFPPRTSYACMAETMMLAMEGRFESFTLGRNLSVPQVDEISRIARKHNFRLAGFRSFERAVDRQDIENIRQNAVARRGARTVAVTM